MKTRLPANTRLAFRQFPVFSSTMQILPEQTVRLVNHDMCEDNYMEVAQFGRCTQCVKEEQTMDPAFANKPRSFQGPSDVPYFYFVHIFIYKKKKNLWGSYSETDDS